MLMNDIILAFPPNQVLMHASRGVKRQTGNKSSPYETYFPTGLAQNNHVFQCSLAQIKNLYPLSGLVREKTVKTRYR